MGKSDRVLKLCKKNKKNDMDIVRLDFIQRKSLQKSLFLLREIVRDVILVMTADATD